MLPGSDVSQGLAAPAPRVDTAAGGMCAMPPEPAGTKARSCATYTGAACTGCFAQCQPVAETRQMRYHLGARAWCTELGSGAQERRFAVFLIYRVFSKASPREKGHFPRAAKNPYSSLISPDSGLASNLHMSFLTPASPLLSVCEPGELGVGVGQRCRIC